MEFASVRECPQRVSFAGRRPSHLPSPGQRPGSRGDNSPKGPTARPFATKNEVVTQRRTKWTNTFGVSNNITRRVLSRTNTGGSAKSTAWRLTNDTFGIELPAQTAGPSALLCVWVLGYPARWAGLGKCLGRWPGEYSAVRHSAGDEHGPTGRHKACRGRNTS